MSVRRRFRHKFRHARCRKSFTFCLHNSVLRLLFCRAGSLHYLDLPSPSKEDQRRSCSIHDRRPHPISLLRGKGSPPSHLRKAADSLETFLMYPFHILQRKEICADFLIEAQLIIVKDRFVSRFIVRNHFPVGGELPVAKRLHLAPKK